MCLYATENLRDVRMDYPMHTISVGHRVAESSGEAVPVGETASQVINVVAR